MTDLPGSPRRDEGLYGTDPTAAPVVTSTGATTNQPYSTDYSDTSGQSKTDVAKQEAGAVKDTAVSAGKDVAATAKSEAANVAQEAKTQAKGLLGGVTTELKSQASSQQQKVASTVHSLAKELGSMASNSSESGPLTDLAQQGSRRIGEIGHWIENREPSDLLQEVKSFARRRPLAFLGISFGLGLLAGRITRGAVAANTELDSPDGARRSAPELTSQRTDYTDYSAPATPVTTPVEPVYYDSGTAGDLGTTTQDPYTQGTYTQGPGYDDVTTRPDFTR